MKRPLKHLTHDLHHAAEQHPVGAAMAAGNISKEWWADWLMSLLLIHNRFDHHLPQRMRRVEQLQKDLAELSVQPLILPAAVAYARKLDTVEALEAAAYVFTGAHLMGGAIAAKANAHRLPVHHLTWDNRNEVVAMWSPYRDRADLEQEVRNAFKAILNIMEEIYANRALAG